MEKLLDAVKNYGGFTANEKIALLKAKTERELISIGMSMCLDIIPLIKETK